MQLDTRSQNRSVGRHRLERTWENSPGRLVVHVWVLTGRILLRWGRDRATVFESLIMPVAFLVTLNIVLGDAITQVSGQDAVYRQAPLMAMVGAMTGAMVGGIGLMRERVDGLLSRLWVLPVHRASGVLSRLAADAVRIVVTTAAVLIAAMVLGFRFQQGIVESLAWVFIPVVFGVAFSMAVVTLALYAQNTLMVEATEIAAALLMFFSIGFVPLEQYPTWIQPVVEHQPVSYSIEVMLGLAVGGPVAEPAMALALWSAGIALVLAIPMAIGYRRASMRA